MKITQLKKVLSFILCVVLIAAIALFTIGCNDNKDTGSEPNTPSEGQQVTETKIVEKGEGDTVFYFNVVDVNGKESKFKISTNKTTVGAALLELSLIAGEDSQYGLYVKTVNGLTLDYDTDGKFWAFYVDGKSAMSGVDSTEITAGATYAFKAE